MGIIFKRKIEDKENDTLDTLRNERTIDAISECIK